MLDSNTSLIGVTATGSTTYFTTPVVNTTLNTGTRDYWSVTMKLKENAASSSGSQDTATFVVEAYDDSGYAFTLLNSTDTYSSYKYDASVLDFYK